MSSFTKLGKWLVYKDPFLLSSRMNAFTYSVVLGLILEAYHSFGIPPSHFEVIWNDSKWSLVHITDKRYWVMDVRIDGTYLTLRRYQADPATFNIAHPDVIKHMADFLILPYDGTYQPGEGN